MKVKYFLMSFLLLILIGLYASTNIRAVKYECDPEPNSAKIYNITSVDVDRLEDMWEPLHNDDEGYYEWQENIFDEFEDAPLGPWGLQVYDSYFVLDKNIDEEGSKCQFKVDNTKFYDGYVEFYDYEEEDEDRADTWKVYIDIWEFIDPDNDFNPDCDVDEEDIDVIEDPDDLNRMSWSEDEEKGACTIFHLGVIIVPTPVVNYLDEIEWLDDEDMEDRDIYTILEDDIATDWEGHMNADEKWDSEEIDNDWNSKENKVIHEGTYPWWDEDDNDWDYEDYEEEWTYDEESGFLSLYQVLDGEDVLLEITLETPLISGYEIPVLLGITAVFTIGLIYVIRKKRKVR